MKTETARGAAASRGCSLAFAPGFRSSRFQQLVPVLAPCVSRQRASGICRHKQSLAALVHGAFGGVVFPTGQEIRQLTTRACLCGRLCRLGRAGRRRGSERMCVEWLERLCSRARPALDLPVARASGAWRTCPQPACVLRLRSKEGRKRRPGGGSSCACHVCHARPRGPAPVLAGRCCMLEMPHVPGTRAHAARMLWGRAGAHERSGE